jgi:UDP-N-acetylmuramate--alanine ligase
MSDMTHVHFIGIGGSGLSAIARLLLESGYTVTGSDSVMSPFAVDLQSAGVTVTLGHDPRNITGAEWVVRSSAIPDNNPEVVAAQAQGIPVYKRADFLGRLMENKMGIAVAGTHGKTTTTAMLAWTLSALGQDPSFILGSNITQLGVNARAGKGNFFVIEADEYDRMFLGLKPKVEIVTYVEHDHPDCYPTPEDFRAAFVDFVKLLPADGTLVACGDEPGAADIAAEARRMGRNVLQYGAAVTLGTSSDWVLAQNYKPNNKGGFSFDATVAGQAYPVALSIPGMHNLRNALAVMAVIHVLALSMHKAAEALGEFSGTGRRFEVRGEANGVTVVDDYGHHPTEIAATLSGARSRYAKRRIWAVWQPHTFSRTKALSNQFANAFSEADEVIVTEIYRSREPAQDYSSQEVVKKMRHTSVKFIAELSDVIDYLISNLQAGDVLIVFSAGDADQISSKVLDQLNKQGVHHERR